MNFVEARRFAAVGDLSSLKTFLEARSTDDLKGSWLSILSSLPEFIVPQGINAVNILPSGSSMCLLKPTSLEDCIAWYVYRAYTLVSKSPFISEALMILLNGIRLCTGLKPGNNFNDVDWSKLPQEVAVLVGLYKAISCYAKLRRIDKSLTFDRFIAGPIDQRVMIAVGTGFDSGKYRSCFVCLDDPRIAIQNPTSDKISKSCSSIGFPDCSPLLQCAVDFGSFDSSKALRSALVINVSKSKYTNSMSLLSQIIEQDIEAVGGLERAGNLLIEVAYIARHPTDSSTRNQISDVIKKLNAAEKSFRNSKIFAANKKIDEEIFREVNAKIQTLNDDMEICSLIENIIRAPPPSLAFRLESRGKYGSLEKSEQLVERLLASGKCRTLKLFERVKPGNIKPISGWMKFAKSAAQRNDFLEVQSSFNSWKQFIGTHAEEISDYLAELVGEKLFALKKIKEIEIVRALLAVGSSAKLPESPKLEQTRKCVEFFETLKMLPSARKSIFDFQDLYIELLLHFQHPTDQLHALKSIEKLFVNQPSIFQDRDSDKIFTVLQISHLPAVGQNEYLKQFSSWEKIHSASLIFAGNFDSALQLKSLDWRSLKSMLSQVDVRINQLMIKKTISVTADCPETELETFLDSIRTAENFGASEDSLSTQSIAEAVVKFPELSNFLIPYLEEADFARLPISLLEALRPHLPETLASSVSADLEIASLANAFKSYGADPTRLIHDAEYRHDVLIDIARNHWRLELPYLSLLKATEPSSVGVTGCQMPKRKLKPFDDRLDSVLSQSQDISMLPDFKDDRAVDSFLDKFTVLEQPNHQTLETVADNCTTCVLLSEIAVERLSQFLRAGEVVPANVLEPAMANIPRLQRSLEGLLVELKFQKAGKTNSQLVEREVDVLALLSTVNPNRRKQYESSIDALAIELSKGEDDIGLQAVAEQVTNIFRGFTNAFSRFTQ